MSTIDIEVSGRLITAARLAARRQHVTAERALDRAIDAAIDAAEAASSRPEGAPEYDPALLEVVAVEPFVVARYDGRIAGIGVEVRSSRSADYNCRGKHNRTVEIDGLMLMDWAPWFVAISRRRTGRQLASSC